MQQTDTKKQKYSYNDLGPFRLKYRFNKMPNTISIQKATYFACLNIANLNADMANQKDPSRVKLTTKIEITDDPLNDIIYGTQKRNHKMFTRAIIIGPFKDVLQAELFRRHWKRSKLNDGREVQSRGVLSRTRNGLKLAKSWNLKVYVLPSIFKQINIIKMTKKIKKKN